MVEDAYEISLQFPDRFFLLLLICIVYEGLRHELGEETYEPFVRELVHIVDFDHAAGYEEELRGALTHWLVHLTRHD